MCASGVQKDVGASGVGGSCELPTTLLGTKLRYSAGAASALNCWVISPAPSIYFTLKHMCIWTTWFEQYVFKWPYYTWLSNFSPSSIKSYAEREVVGGGVSTGTISTQSALPSHGFTCGVRAYIFQPFNKLRKKAWVFLWQEATFWDTQSNPLRISLPNKKETDSQHWGHTWQLGIHKISLSCAPGSTAMTCKLGPSEESHGD